MERTTRSPASGRSATSPCRRIGHAARSSSTTTALGTYTNLASSGSSTPPDNNSTNNSGDATVTVRTGNADLYIAKGVFPQVALVGDEIVYQVEVGNKGPDTARGVVRHRRRPRRRRPQHARSSRTSSTTTGTITFDPDGTIRWDVGDLAVNQTEQATIYAVLRDPRHEGQHVDRRCARMSSIRHPDDNSDTAQLVADPRPVDIGVTKTSTERAAPMRPYRSARTSPSRSPPQTAGRTGATNVIFDDVLDPAFTIVSSRHRRARPSMRRRGPGRCRRWRSTRRSRSRSSPPPPRPANTAT